jgi:hypothetical protein
MNINRILDRYQPNRDKINPLLLTDNFDNPVFNLAKRRSVRVLHEKNIIQSIANTLNDYKDNDRKYKNGRCLGRIRTWEPN